LKCVVRNRKSAEDVENIREFTSYMVTLMHLKQKGYELFVKYYKAPDSLSEEYKTWLKAENKSQLEIELGLKIPEDKQAEINTFLFERKHKEFFEKKRTIRMGAKFKEVHHNPNLSPDEILSLQKSPKAHKSHSLPQEDDNNSPLIPELKKSRSALEHPGTNSEPPKFSQETQKLSEDEEEIEVSEENVSTASYQDGSKFAFSMIRSGSVSPLLSASKSNKSVSPHRSVSPTPIDMEIEPTPMNFEDEYRYTELALNSRAYNPAEDPPSQNKKRSQSDNGSVSSFIQIEETSPGNSATKKLSRKNSSISAPGTVEKSLEIIQQIPPPTDKSLLSEYIQHQVKDKRIINQIRLKEKNEQLKKSTSLPQDLVESRSYVPKAATDQHSGVLQIDQIQAIQAMTPEEYMRDKQKRETQAIDLIRKLQGNKPKMALPKHFQKFMNNNDLPTDDLVLQDDVFGFGQRTAASPRMEDNVSIPQRSAVMNPELPDNFVFNESSLPRGGIRKSLSAEDGDSSNSLRNNKKKVLPKRRSNISDTPQFGNSQETNSGENSNSRGRMEIEPLNKEQFAKIMKEKHEASKKALEEKKRKILERNKKELWDDMEEEEKPKSKSTKPSPTKPSPAKPVKPVYHRREPEPEVIMEEEKRETQQLKGQIIHVATRKTDSLRTVQKVLGLQTMEEIEPMPFPNWQREHSPLISKSPSPRNNDSIEKKKSTESKEIVKKKTSHEEKRMNENSNSGSGRKKKGERNVEVSVDNREETAHFRVEISEDLKTPHVHIYSSKSKVHLQLSHSSAKGSKEKPPILHREEESEEEEEIEKENSDHDEWLEPHTQDDFLGAGGKSRYFNNEIQERSNKTEDTNSSALSFSNKKLFKPKLNEKGPINIMTFSQINPNVREKPASPKASKENKNVPKILISGKSPSKAAKLTNNHDNWLDFQDSQESLQNDSSEHSLMETLRVPPKTVRNSRRKPAEAIEEDEEGEDYEEEEKTSTRGKAQIPLDLFTKQGKKEKGKYFHDDWLESYESNGPESKKSTPGKDWQIKAAQNVSHVAPKKGNILTDKLLSVDKKFQEKKSQSKKPQEKSDEDSFGFDAEPVVVFEGDKRMVVSDRKKSSQASGKMSFGKSTYTNLHESDEEENILVNKRKEEPKKKPSVPKELETRGTLEEPIDVESLPVKRKRGRPRKVQPEEERIVSVGTKIDLTPIDLFKDCGIYPLKKVKKTPKVKPLQQNAEENLRKLLDVFIDKKSFQ